MCIRDRDEGILHHSEGVDLMPANIELSALEVSLVNAMSREFKMCIRDSLTFEKGAAGAFLYSNADG